MRKILYYERSESMKVDYKPQTITFGNLMTQITIPQFQRGQVWVHSKRVNFIKAILDGYPFGSLPKL